MQKSQNGFLRTLLFEIIQQCLDLIGPACGDRRASQGQESNGGFIPWTDSDLHMVLRKVLALDPNRMQFCFFIDGLDEYEGDFHELCKVLLDLSKLPNIKLCVSSRPLNAFDYAFGGNIQRKLYMQDLTRHDILRYIRHSLSGHDRWSLVIETESQGDWLIGEIEKRASGIFLWVFLVVKRLQESFVNWVSFSDIRRRLESFPTELSDFFRNILESVEPFYWNKMSAMLQMAIAVDEPLHAMAYDFHSQGHDNEDYIFEVPIEPYSSIEERKLKSRIGWWLNSWSRGLLEVNQEYGTVTFLHRSVTDFFKTKAMSRFLIEKQPPGFVLQNCLLKVFVGLIKRYPLDEQVDRETFGVYKSCHLQSFTTSALHYAAKMDELQPSNVQLYRVLDELDRTVMYRTSCREIRFDNFHPREPFLREQLIRGQHVGFLKWKLPHDPRYVSYLGPSLILQVLSSGTAGEFSLDRPWQSQGIEILRLILETQDLDQNELGQGNNSPSKSTSWACEKPGRKTDLRKSQAWQLLEENIVSTLLHKGADPMAILWHSNTETWPVFAAYLELAFGVKADGTHEATYLRVLKDFLNAGATLDTGYYVKGITRLNLACGIRIATPGVFFSRLDSVSVACNLKLLAEVIDILFSSFANTYSPSYFDSSTKTIRRIFPTDVCHRLQTRHPTIEWI